MKLRYDLMRKILAHVEAQPPNSEIQGIEVACYERSEVDYHVHLAVQAGYLEAIDIGTLGKPMQYMVRSLTWDGQKALERLRKEGCC